MSGSGHLMSGQTLYVKNRDANTVEALCYRFADGEPMGGMKMANGTNSQRPPPFPETRGKSAALVRETFVAALEYRRKVQAAGDDVTKLPPRDLGHEALLELVDGKRIVHHHTHRHDDIATVLRLSKEFGFRVVLHHVSEAYKVADLIVAANAPCSLIVIDTPGGKLEASEFDARSAAELERLGAPVPAQRRARGARGRFARDGARGADDQRCTHARPGRARRKPRSRQGRGFHRAFGRSAVGVHTRRADLGRRREGLRSV
jgi:hypothetical protein